MIDLHDKSCPPTLEDVAQAIGNPLFRRFCQEITDRHGCRVSIEYSGCSMEPGWNVKMKKSGRALCTIYPREGFFTAMVVVGRREKDPVEAILPGCCPRLGEIYAQTREGNGQRWLMIDLEDRDRLYQDVFRLIDIRRTC